jgi:hypothetical protein
MSVNITRKLIDEIDKDMQVALKGIEEKYGLSLSIGGYSFSPHNLTTKITGKVAEVNGKSIEQFEFENTCKVYNLKAEDYGKTFIANNKEYILVRVDIKKYKFPIIGKSVETGKLYKFPREVVNQLD